MSKILLVCNADFTFNKFLIPLANKLLKKGFSVGVICDGKKINYDNLDGRVEFHNVSIPRKVSVRKFIFATRSIRKVIIDNKYQLVNSNNRNASFLTRLAMLTMPFSGVKNIYTARGMYFHDSQHRVAYLLTYWLEVFLLFFTDLILSQSKEDVSKLSQNPFVNSSKLKVINNGIDEVKFSIDKINYLDLKLNGFIVCTTGRISNGKGLEDLLESFSIFSKFHPNCTLLLIGGVLYSEHDNLLSNFLEKANQLNVREKIFITGLVDNVQDYLSKADVYIHPSYREGVPRSILEAMSLEKIVIATNIRGAREIITNDINGILYKKGDTKSLSELIKKVCLMSDYEKKRISLQARKRVLESYTEKSYLKVQSDLISQIK